MNGLLGNLQVRFRWGRSEELQGQLVRADAILMPAPKEKWPPEFRCVWWWCECAWRSASRGTELSFCAASGAYQFAAAGACGVFYNSSAARRFPHAQSTPVRPVKPRQSFSDADLDAALVHYKQVLDGRRDHLTELLRFPPSTRIQELLRSCATC